MRVYSSLLFVFIAACSNSNTHDTDAGNHVDAGVSLDASTDASLPPPDASVHALTANDVSVLFPLSGPSTRDALWPATLEANGGALFPRSVFDNLPEQFNPQHETHDQAYADLRVVAVRFDPCFPDGTVCHSQVRLVLQTISPDGEAEDGAVHLLYNVSESNMVALIAELRALTAYAPENVTDAPLRISPALVTQGVNGSYGVGLRNLVTRYAGAANLARFTFMTRTLARSGTWRFGGANLVDFAPMGAISIVGLDPDTTIQQVVNTVSPHFEYSFTPDDAAEPNILPVLRESAHASLSASQLNDAHEALALLENPLLSNADSVDCASCHVAGRIRGYLLQEHMPSARPANEYEGQAMAPRITGVGDTGDNLRAFGYFVVEPAISQRVANETREVLAAIERDYP